MIKNILKIVFLGIVGFVGLVYMTAPEEMLKPKKIDENRALSWNYLPSHYEEIGNSFYTKKQVLLDKETYLVVLNHDAFAVFNELYKYTNKNILLIANVSKTPWFIKKLAVDGKLEELYENSKIKIVNDSSGEFVRALKINNIQQNRYFIFKLNKNKTIEKVAEGDVTLNALEKGLSKEDLLKDINKFIELIK